MRHRLLVVGIASLALLSACSKLIDLQDVTYDGDPPDAPEASCSDGVLNGNEADIDCGGVCGGCAIGKGCAMGTDCAAGGVCESAACRAARSCAEILLQHPGSADGVYTIAPGGVTAPFSAVCDMTRDGGGWTLLLKANGDTTLNFLSPLWANTTLLNDTDLTTAPGNAKYPSFVTLPVSVLRGELDGFRYMQSFASVTAQRIFAASTVLVNGHPSFNTGAPNWSTQPNCKAFGINTGYEYSKTRFGWTANQEPDCLSNDTAIGLGLTGNGAQRGAGYQCLSTECSAGTVDVGGHGLLWAK